MALGHDDRTIDLARRAVAESSSVPAAQTGVGALPPLLEALALGLEPSLVEPLVVAYLAASSVDEAAHRVAQAVLEGAKASATSDAARLEQAALALLKPDVGLRRALWHAVGTGWRAIAAGLQRNTTDAARFARDAATASSHLGHRPLERWALAISAHLTSS